MTGRKVPILRYGSLTVILTAALLCLCTCARKVPSGIPAKIWVPDEENTSVTETDGTLYIDIPSGTQTADLSPLSGRMDSGRLHVYAPGTLKTLTLPSGTVSATVGPDTASAEEPFLLDLLDASAAESLTQLALYGQVKSAWIPESLHTAVFFGGDLSDFAECSSLTNLSVLHPTDLSPLRDSSLGVLSLFRAPDDETWDLTPLVGKPLAVLRLMAGVSAEEAAALAGASIQTLQVSDASVDDLSFLFSMPDTKVLMLGVSSDQPLEILNVQINGPCGPDLLPLVNTSVPTQQLLAFAGQIYVFSEIGR